MKKMLKKFSLLAVSTLLVASLAACGGGNSGTGTGTGTGTNTGGTNDGGQQREVIKIDVLSQLANFAGEQGGWFGKVVEDKFGIKMNIIAPNLEGGATKFATMMASGNLGDLVVFGNDGQDYRDAIRAGLIMDWNTDGLLEKHGQDIVKTVPAALEKAKNIFGEGEKVYGLGHDAAAGGLEGPSEGNTMVYQVEMRWDLWDKLGKPQMNSMEDLLPVLKQMQELEPKSNSGRPTYGFSLWSDWDGNYMTLGKQFATMYGYDHGDMFNPGGMLLVHANEDKYQELLQDDSYYMRALKLYYDANQMGLVDPDSLTQKFDDVSNKFRDGQVLFSWFPWLSSAYNTPEHTEQGKGFAMTGFSEQKIYSYGQNPGGGNRVWSIGSKTKHAERIMEFLNWLYTPEGMMTVTNGPEGLTWEMKDGKAALTDFGKQALTDGSTQVPAEWGGGEYKDGVPAINNTTLKPSNINPNTGEQYDWNTWSSVLESNPNPVEQAWREHFGVLTPKELLLKNDQIEVNTPLVTSEIPAIMDDSMTQKLNQVGTVIKQYSWKMVFAKNEAEFNSLKAEMVQKAKGLGYDEIVAWDIANTTKAFELRKAQ